MLLKCICPYMSLNFGSPLFSRDCSRYFLHLVFFTSILHMFFHPLNILPGEPFHGAVFEMNTSRPYIFTNLIFEPQGLAGGWVDGWRSIQDVKLHPKTI